MIRLPIELHLSFPRRVLNKRKNNEAPTKLDLCVMHNLALNRSRKPQTLVEKDWTKGPLTLTVLVWLQVHGQSQSTLLDTTWGVPKQHKNRLHTSTRQNSVMPDMGWQLREMGGQIQRNGATRIGAVFAPRLHMLLVLTIVLRLYWIYVSSLRRRNRPLRGGELWRQTRTC